MSILIFDTSPIQYLHQLGLLESVPLIVEYKICTPTAVVKELDVGRQNNVNLPDITRLPWIHVQDVKSPLSLQLAWDLGAGEREAIALALELDETLVVLDDGLARRAAENLDVLYTGTLGLIRRFKQAEVITEVGPTVQKLKNLGFHLDQNTEKFFLKLNDE